MKQNRLTLTILATAVLLNSCISTKDIPEDDQLFRGLTKITYQEKMTGERADELKEEVETALATAPNGAILGSSYYHVPWSWRLWVYNKYSQKSSKFARWMTRSFGRAPVLMSQVNPALRATVAQSVLRNYGYFRGSVGYETVNMKDPKKGKISYTVRLDSLFTFDSIAYVGFPDSMRMLIDSTQQEALIRKGEPFSVSSLEGERNRLTSLLRNNGYYAFQPNYTSYLADTIVVPQRVQTQLKLASGLPEEALRPWYIGNIDLTLRRSTRELMTDTVKRGHLTIHYNGKRSPIRPRVVLKDLKLRPRQLYSYSNYQESVNKLNTLGIFSSVDLQLTPRDQDTLDLRLNCTFDKPYDFYVETAVNGRTIGRYGPEVKIGFTRRNAFHGGEKLDVNLHGSYEWQKNSNKDMSTYQYGIDGSIEFPRILFPFIKDRPRRDKNGQIRRRQLYAAPTTIAKGSTDISRRPGYYKMHIVSGEWTYRWQPSAQHRHELSPLTLKYQYMNSHTEQFDTIVAKNMYTMRAMEDHFIPKMRYTYTYTSPATQRNPIRWETTIEEAGNIIALYDVLIQGYGWNQKGKTMFKNPYSQFVRFETDFTKTWTLNSSSTLVGHLNAGIIHSFGNANEAPFAEQFYAGGANSIRAFAVRGIGPGAVGFSGPRQFSYLLQNGDLKFIGNLEYRPRLFGNLEGALFLDVGNVWMQQLETVTVEEVMNTGADREAAEATVWIVDYMADRGKFKFNRFFDQLAVGTGIGLRYNLGFLAIRIDWGVALHLPYNTGRSGYFNASSFSEAQALHFAIGYPF